MSSHKLDQTLIKRAVKALFDHEEKQASASGKPSLVGRYSKAILAQVRLKEEIKKPVQRPVRVKILHSLFNRDNEDHSICLFVRSEDKEAVEAFLERNPIEGVDKIVSMNDVKKIYNQFKDRKKLLSEHTHFICDARIMNHLYNALGKTFLGVKRHPVPIDFGQPQKLAAEIKKVVESSTYMHLQGQVISIRFGHTGMAVADVTANIVTGLDFAASKLKDQWKGIHSIFLKTPDSAALPLWSKDAATDGTKFLRDKVKEEEKGKGKEAKSSASQGEKEKEETSAKKKTEEQPKGKGKESKEQATKTVKETDNKLKAKSTKGSTSSAKSESSSSSSSSTSSLVSTSESTTTRSTRSKTTANTDKESTTAAQKKKGKREIAQVENDSESEGGDDEEEEEEKEEARSTKKPKASSGKADKAPAKTKAAATSAKKVTADKKKK